MPESFPDIEAAACRREDPELFFPRLPHHGKPSTRANTQITEAKSVCRRCPVRTACLGTALARRENLGIWGGQTPAERRQTLRDIQALRRDVRHHIRRLMTGQRVILGTPETLAVVHHLRQEASWTLEQAAEALGLHTAAVYDLYRRALTAAQAANLLTTAHRRTTPMEDAVA